MILINFIWIIFHKYYTINFFLSILKRKKIDYACFLFVLLPESIKRVYLILKRNMSSFQFTIKTLDNVSSLLDIILSVVVRDRFIMRNQKIFGYNRMRIYFKGIVNENEVRLIINLYSFFLFIQFIYFLFSFWL